jgi:hypothetical protein
MMVSLSLYFHPQKTGHIDARGIDRRQQELEEVDFLSGKRDDL